MNENCKYYDWTRGQISALINNLGEENARSLLAGETLIKFDDTGIAIKKADVSKCSDWTEGQVEALINVIGEESAKKISAGEAAFSVERLPQRLFDKNGRRIPKGLSFHVCDPLWPERLENFISKIDGDYQTLIDEFNRPLGGILTITGDEFQAETERLLWRLKEDKNISGIINGAWLPIIIPAYQGQIKDSLDSYLRAAKYAYARHCGASFDFKDMFYGEVQCIPDSRYPMVLNQSSQRDQVGLYFFDTLSGFSILASREQMKDLPAGFVLAGFEPLIAAAMYPKILSGYNVFLDLSAFSWVLGRGGNYEQFVLRTRDAGLSYGPNLSLNWGSGNRYSGLLYIG